MRRVIGALAALQRDGVFASWRRPPGDQAASLQGAEYFLSGLILIHGLEIEEAVGVVVA